VLVPTIKTVTVLKLHTVMCSVKNMDKGKLISKLNDNITDVILYEMKEVVFFTLHQKFGNVSTSDQLNPKCAVIYQSIPYNPCKLNVI
jgi:hypothetical protein